MTTGPISKIRKTGSNGPSGRRPPGRLSFFMFGHWSAMRGIEPRAALGSAVQIPDQKHASLSPAQKLPNGTGRRGADLLRKPSRSALRMRGGCAFGVRMHTRSGFGFTGTGWRTERARTVPGTVCRTKSAGNVIRPAGRTGRTGRRFVFLFQRPKKRKRKQAYSAGSGCTPYAGARRVEVVEIIGRIRVSQACR